MAIHGHPRPRPLPTALRPYGPPALRQYGHAAVKCCCSCRCSCRCSCARAPACGCGCGCSRGRGPTAMPQPPGGGGGSPDSIGSACLGNTHSILAWPASGMEMPVADRRGASRSVCQDRELSPKEGQGYAHIPFGMVPAVQKSPNPSPDPAVPAATSPPGLPRQLSHRSRESRGRGVPAEGWREGVAWRNRGGDGSLEKEGGLRRIEGEPGTADSREFRPEGQHCCFSRHGPWSMAPVMGCGQYWIRCRGAGAALSRRMTK